MQWTSEGSRLAAEAAQNAVSELAGRSVRFEFYRGDTTLQTIHALRSNDGPAILLMATERTLHRAGEPNHWRAFGHDGADLMGGLIVPESEPFPAGVDPWKAFPVSLRVKVWP